MDSLRSIEIDFDIHKMIELERRGFDEPEHLALRRLLKLATSEENPKASNSKNSVSPGRPWSGKGVELPHGTELRMEYNGQVFRGKIENGEWVVEGARSKSPSDAAGRAATTKSGTRPSLNGWIYWDVKRPTDADWRALKSLRL